MAKAVKKVKKVKKPTTTTTKTVQKKASDEDLILGKSNETEMVMVVDCFNKKVTYKIKNLILDNNPTYMSGDMVKNFFNSTNKAAMDKIEQGGNEATILDEKGNELYFIELV